MSDARDVIITRALDECLTAVREMLAQPEYEFLPAADEMRALCDWIDDNREVAKKLHDDVHHWRKRFFGLQDALGEMIDEA